MGIFSDDIREFSSTLRDTARDVSQIRTDWVATQDIFVDDHDGNVTVQQAKQPAAVAAAKGNVLSAAQWNMPGFPSGFSTGAGGGLAILAAGALLLLLVVK